MLLGASSTLLLLSPTAELSLFAATTALLPSTACAACAAEAFWPSCVDCSPEALVEGAASPILAAMACVNGVSDCHDISMHAKAIATRQRGFFNFSNICPPLRATQKARKNECGRYDSHIASLLHIKLNTIGFCAENAYRCVHEHTIRESKHHSLDVRMTSDAFFLVMRHLFARNGNAPITVKNS